MARLRKEIQGLAGDDWEPTSADLYSLRGRAIRSSPYGHKPNQARSTYQSCTTSLGARISSSCSVWVSAIHGRCAGCKAYPQYFLWRWAHPADAGSRTRGFNVSRQVFGGWCCHACQTSSSSTKPKSYTPLHATSYHGHTGCVRLLLEKGAFTESTVP